MAEVFQPTSFRYLARLRWPEGYVCPSCSSTRAGVYDEGQVDVRSLSPADLGDRRDDLPTDPHPVADVIRGDPVHHLTEEWHVRVEPAKGSGHVCGH